MSAMPERTLADTERLIADLQRQLGECRAEFAARNSEYGERIAHQSASNEVLKVMSASPGDPQPVFNLITRGAWELCNANGAALYGFDGELIHLLSADGTAWTSQREAAYRRQFPTAPTRGSSFGRAILNRQIVHIRDFDADPEVAQYVRDLDVRSAVGVPLLRDGMVIGAIALNAKEPGGLSDGEVELLETFAEQAVIAITSAETYRELRQRTGNLQESLEYQTATSDVLKVISRSPKSIMARSLIGSLALVAVLVATLPLCIAQESKTGLYAASVMWRYFYEIDATLATCLRVDPSDAQSYIQMRGTFATKGHRLLADISSLVHYAEKRAHHQGKEFREATQEEGETIKEEIEQTAATDNEGFRSRCRMLRNAVVNQSGLFQPLEKKFSAEYKMIQNWAAEMNALSSDGSTIQLPPEATIREDKATCEARGGKWGPLGGLLNRIGCNIPYSDGGRICSDSSDCQGRCIFESQLENLLTGKPVKEFRPGEPVTGVCARWRIMFGCFTYVHKGKTKPGPCID
jgi:hypothetical protein